VIVAPIAEMLRLEQEELTARTEVTAQLGQSAEAILLNPVLREFFVAEALRLYKAFLDAPDAELVARRNEARHLNQLYLALSKAVGAGRTAAARLANQQEESTR
jgi:hypothetical protein